MKKLILLFLLFATVASAQNPLPVFQGGQGRNYLDTLRILLGKGRQPVISLAAGTDSMFLMSRGTGILPVWSYIDLVHSITGILDTNHGGTSANTANDALNNLLPSQTGDSGRFLMTDGINTSWQFTPGTANSSISIGDTVKNSTNYRLLNVDASHHLGEITNTTSGRVLRSNGTGAAPSYSTLSSLGAVVKSPVSVDENLIRPIVTGSVSPLQLMTGGSGSTADAFSVHKYDSIMLFRIDTGIGVHIGKDLYLHSGVALNFTDADNPLGLFDGVSLNYGNPNQVLISQGSGATPKWQDVDSLISPSGLINWHDSLSTIYPNNAVYATALIPNSISSDAIIKVEQGYGGSFLLAIPDGSAYGGDKRGNNSVDLQIGRTSSSQVASGDNSIIAAGYANSVSGDQSFVTGFSNENNGTTSAIFGEHNSIISGGDNFICGVRTSVNGNGVFAFNGSGSTMGISASGKFIIANSEAWLAATNGSSVPLVFWDKNSTTGAFPPAGLNYASFRAVGLDTSIDYYLPKRIGSAGDLLALGTNDTLYWTSAGSGGIGTVTSVAASGGATGLSFTGSPINTSGTLTQTGTLNETHGGTGQTSYTTGDITYASASNTISKRAIGSSGDVLTVSGGVPVWAAPTSSAMSRITLSGLDATATSAGTIGLATGDFIVIAVVVRLTAANAITVQPTLSIGTNSPNWDNLAVPATANLNNVNDVNYGGVGVGTFGLDQLALFIPSGTLIKYNITGAATATTMTLAIDIIGYYL